VFSSQKLRGQVLRVVEVDVGVGLRCVVIT